MGADLSSLNGATIAFDLDGTLVDTAPDLVAALNLALTTEGLAPLPLEMARPMIGRGGRWMLRRGFEAAGVELSETRLDALLDRFIDHYRAHIADESLPFPGCVEALDGLLSAGARLAVCTNKREELSHALIGALNLSNKFAAIVGPDTAGAQKPDPKHLLAAIALAGGDPARAVMVGDATPDAEAARAAGIPLILVSFGYTEIPAHELGPDILIHHYDELAEASARLLRR